MRWLIAIALYLCASTSIAANVMLAWDYGAQTIQGFRVYCSATKGQWPQTPTATTPANTKQAQVAVTGRLWCVVRAYDADGESLDSNLLALLEGPSNLRTASQSVQFDPATERVAMSARIIDKETGAILSEVATVASN